MLRSVTDGSTFPPGLPRSVGTSHVLLRCDQVLLRLSSSVKVFYDETLAMNSQVHNFQKLINISLKAVNVFSNKYKSNLFQ